VKEIVKFDKELGADGAKAEGAVVIVDGNVKAQVSISYPLTKIIEPATTALDKAIDKLKAAIPGTWDDALLDKVKTEYKEELAKYLSGV
jgi:hypothetical protein